MRRGLTVSALVSGSRGPSSSLGLGHNWVPENLTLGFIRRWTSIQSKGDQGYWNRDKHRPDGPLGSYGDLVFHLKSGSSIIKRLLSALIPFLLLLSCSNDPNIVTSLTCDQTEEEEVHFLAFRFGGQSEDASVTFSVTAIVCLPESSSECYLDCDECGFGSGFPGRKRRSLDVDRAVKTKYYLEVGPYKFGNVNKKNQKGLWKNSHRGGHGFYTTRDVFHFSRQNN